MFRRTGRLYMPESNGVGPMGASFGAGAGLNQLDLAALYFASSMTVTLGSVTAAHDLGPNGFDLTKLGAGNLVFNPADANMNGQPTFTGLTNNGLEIAQAIVPLGAVRTVVFWGYSADNIGSKYCQFGDTLLIQPMFKVIGGANTYTLTDNVGADNHYNTPAIDVVANEPICLIQTITPGAVSVFQKNGVAVLQAETSTVSAETGNYFLLGGASGGFWNGAGIAGLAVFNSFGPKELAYVRSKSAQFGIVF